MKIRMTNLVSIASMALCLGATAAAWAQPANCGCGTGTPCASTQCLKPCYTCCNNNCTNMVCCQDWCDSRALTCNETPGGPDQ